MLHKHTATNITTNYASKDSLQLNRRTAQWPFSGTVAMSEMQNIFFNFLRLWALAGWRTAISELEYTATSIHNERMLHFPAYVRVCVLIIQVTTKDTYNNNANFVLHALAPIHLLRKCSSWLMRLFLPHSSQCFVLFQLLFKTFFSPFCSPFCAEGCLNVWFTTNH